MVRKLMFVAFIATVIANMASAYIPYGCDWCVR